MIAAPVRKHKQTSPRPNPYAVCQVRRGNNGYALVNAVDIRLAKAYICPKCKVRDYKTGNICRVAYAHKRTQRDHCDECEVDRIAMIGIALERQGIPLGWGVAEHTREYERESHQEHRAR